jgi:hypothetical protein
VISGWVQLHNELKVLIKLGQPPLWSSDQSSWPDPEVPGSIPGAARFSEK